MRGGHWLQRGHFHDPASKVVGKVWPLLWNSGQRVVVPGWNVGEGGFGVGASGWNVGEGGFGVGASGWNVGECGFGVGASGWMSLFLFAGGRRGESREDGIT